MSHTVCGHWWRWCCRHRLTLKAVRSLKPSSAQTSLFFTINFVWINVVQAAFKQCSSSSITKEGYCKCLFRFDLLSLIVGINQRQVFWPVLVDIPRPSSEVHEQQIKEHWTKLLATKSCAQMFLISHDSMLGTACLLTVKCVVGRVDWTFSWVVV